MKTRKKNNRDSIFHLFLVINVNVAEKLNYFQVCSFSVSLRTQFKIIPTRESVSVRSKAPKKGKRQFISSAEKWQKQKNNCLNSELDRWCIIHWHLAFVSTFQWMSINPVPLQQLFVQLILLDVRLNCEGLLTSAAASASADDVDVDVFVSVFYSINLFSPQSI